MKQTGNIARRGAIGGSAGTGGVLYGASVAAWCASKMLSGGGADLPWKLPAGALITRITCESDTDVDDIVLDISPAARVYIQVKHGLDAGSEYRKAVDQFVRQFNDAGFHPECRLVLVTDGSASGTVRNALARGVEWFHDLPADVPLADFPHVGARGEAVRGLRDAIQASWIEHFQTAPTEEQQRGLLGCIHVTVIDSLDGAEKNAATEALRTLFKRNEVARVWTDLSTIALDAGRQRRPFNVSTILLQLSARGIHPIRGRVQAPALASCDAAAMSHRTIATLAAARRFAPSTFIKRAQADQELTKFLQSAYRFRILSGSSGEGKTSWCAAACTNSGDSLRLLVLGESVVDGDRSLRHTVQRELAEYQLVSCPSNSSAETDELFED